MSTVIAKNQTAGNLTLYSVAVPNNQIPASGQVTLTDYAKLNEIQGDEEIQAYIDSDDILLNVDGVDLDKSQSASYSQSLAVATLSEVDAGTVDSKAVSPKTLNDSALTGQVNTNTADIAGKENAFTKNSAFNKEFGTAPGTVLEGDTTTITGTQASDITTNNAKVSFPEAPNDGKQYARKNLAWDEIASSGTPGYQPIISLRSTDTTSTISQNAPLAVSWDTEVEKDAGFTHNTSVNASRVEVDTDGTYLISGSIRVYSTAQRFQTVAYISKNGSTLTEYPMGSSYIRNSGSSTDYWNCVINPPPLKLSAGDYVEVEIQIESQLTVAITGTLIGDESSFTVTKLSGEKGEKGDTGAGSNIVIQKDDSTVGTVTNTLNFEGVGVDSVVDEGGNKTTVNITGLDPLQTCTLDGSSNIITPAQLASDQDNYNPPGFGSCNLIRQDINGQRIITGFVAPAAGVNRIFAITNISGSSELKFKNNDSSSTAANRLLLRDNGPDKSLKENETAVFYYDHTSNRWRVYNRVG